MNVYGTKQIRNVVLLGHGGAGKTTVAEALALVTGTTKRMGKVPEGTTISDYDKEEIKRQFSISTTLIPLEYQGEDGPIKINLLDTPGYFDFVGEVEEAISVADAAVIVVNCKAGIEVGTEKAWELCEEYNLPRLFFVTNMDDDQASFRELILKLEKQFGRKIAPFQVPIRENEKFVGFVNAVKMEGRRFTHLSEYEKCEIPEYTKKNLGIIRDALIEAVAETSEEYMERYFSGEEFTQEEITQALREHVSQGNIVPVMMGSGVNAQGFAYLLQAIDKYFPSPDKFECVGVDVSTAERFTAKYNDDVSLSARVFKTVVDPFIGKYSLMKICTGTLKPDTVIYNVNKNAEEKVQKVYVLRGKDVIVVDDMISSGDSILDVSLQLKEKGARRIFLFETFGLFCNGLDIFDKAYKEEVFTKIFTTNLIYRTPELLSREWYQEVNMCKYVAYIIDTLNHDETISNLLNPVTRIHNLLEKQNQKIGAMQITIDHGMDSEIKG